MPVPAQSSKGLTMAMISDTGGPIASGTSFYYNIGSLKGSFKPTNSLGPGPQAVSTLVQSWKPSEVFAIGDIAYNVAASTTLDASIGQYYNNFIHPYPSPLYSKAPYLSIGGNTVTQGQRQWPYNLYNFPQGFPNPIDANAATGGSPDQRNHFWTALGNHDYGMEIGYGQIGVTPYNFNGAFVGKPVGPTSATTLQSTVDYLLPFLKNPELLGDNRSRLNIGSIDDTGNRGVYYSMSFGGTSSAPLIEFFLLDSERLNVNAGMEKWNPSGSKTLVDADYDANGNLVGGRYVNAIKDNEIYSLTYDPTLPANATDPANPLISGKPYAGTTNAPDNGYDQYQWLDRSLAASKAQWKVITAHHPVYASGRWKDEQPDDHMSNAYLQRLLKALPAGSFDAYYNGHDHFYERVLESKPGGIGLGIPFITNGNSGRNLEAKMQLPYGTSVYTPPPGGSFNQDPNKNALKYLLDSGPLLVGASGLTGSPDKNSKTLANGLYGYGFGAVKLNITDDHLLLAYEEAPLIDSAIANHLPAGIAPEAGFAGTTKNDWIPNPNGTFDFNKDLAIFKLSITNGIVTHADKITGGAGYMSSKGGNHVVRGFNIYGNNVDLVQPWLGTAQVDLTFEGGSLSKVDLTDGGQGYELAVQSAADRNDATTTDTLTADKAILVAINYNLDEIQYQVRDNSLYNDWYMIANTDAAVTYHGIPGNPGFLQVQMQARGAETRQLLGDSLAPTTGYSGTGAQAFSTMAQGGNFSLSSNQTPIVSGTLRNGSWFGYVNQLPTSPESLQFSFNGDPLTSYNVNFKPSSGASTPTFDPVRSRGEQAYYRAQSLLDAPPTNSFAALLGGSDNVAPLLVASNV